MKKLLVLVLLVPILALTMISCDESVRSDIAGFMGGFNGNVYESAGLIALNTENADAASNEVNKIGTGAGVTTVPDIGPSKGKTSAMGFEVTVDEGTKLLAPQLPAKQKEVKNTIDKALSGSKAAKDVFLDDLKNEITPEQKAAAEGTVEVFNKTIGAVLTGGNLDPTSDLGVALGKLTLPPVGSNPTKGDLLVLQLMTDLISNTVSGLNRIGGGTDGDGGSGLSGVTGGKLEANKAEVLSIVNDALFAAKIAEQVSGAASIDFSAQFDISGFVGKSAKGSNSRDNSLKLSDVPDFIGTINKMGPSIVKLMGVTYGADTYSYTPEKYNSFLSNQKIYRSLMEQALTLMKLGKLTNPEIKALKLNPGTMVKYALSVFVTEHDAFWVAKSTVGAPTPGAIIALYLNNPPSNKKLGLGTLTKDDVLTQPTDITGFDYDDWPTHLKTKTIDYYKAILNQIIRINEAGGFADLGTELVKFRDAAPENDGLTKWFNEL